MSQVPQYLQKEIMNIIIKIVLIIAIIGLIAFDVIRYINAKEARKNQYGDTSGLEPVKFKLNKFMVIPVVLLVLSFCITFVPANNVGIKWSFIGGTKESTLSEGIAFKTPFDKIFFIPTTVQEKEIEQLTVQTKDSQFVRADVNVKFQVDKANAYKVYKNYGTLDNMKASIISNFTQKAVEKATLKFNVIEVLGENKIDIYQEATKELSAMLKEEGITLKELIIKDTDAGADIEKAIEDEAVAKKKVETAEQVKLKAQKEAETKIIKAKATAEANEILTENLTDEILMNKWIEKWDGKLPTVSNGKDVMIDISKLSK